MEPKPFNHGRAVFYLVAATFGLYGATAFIAAMACTFGVAKIPCPTDGRFAEAFGTLLASALAFAAGKFSGDGK